MEVFMFLDVMNTSHIKKNNPTHLIKIKNKRQR